MAADGGVRSRSSLIFEKKGFDDGNDGLPASCKGLSRR